MFDVASLSCAGGRDYNQDFCSYVCQNGYICIAVADGLGSYVGSDIASKTAVEFILNKFASDLKFDIDFFNPKYAAELINGAHDSVVAKKKGQNGIENSCTTIAVVISDGTRTIMSHIGDTRIYLIENYKISYQSLDHSLAQTYVDCGIISKDQLRTHPDQNKLLRVLGSERYKGADTVIHTNSMRYGDGFAVVTDGWWELITEKELTEEFAFGTAQETLDSLKDILELKMSALHDNYSAVICKFNDLPKN